ncbi:MAG: tRNA pseudouridine(13) synthase TruD [Myxococcota bacterium]
MPADALPYLTRGVPGCGGIFKATPEDFVVEELPAYEASGEGEHLFLWVEKRGRSTQDVAKALARALGVPEKDVSWAGLKDRQAVARQLLSVPAKKAEGLVPTLALPGVSVLWAKRHRNKLKAGHLKGNRFWLTLRGVKDVGAARAALDVLRRRGVPNFFGDQRFGVAGDNAEKGKAILLAGGRHRDRFERKLFLSAYQSALFNRVLAARLEADTFTTALAGDVLKKHATGGEFVCEAPEVDQARVDAFEVSPTGPLFGPEMRSPSGAAAALEAQVLTADGVTAELFASGGGETAGARRFLRIPLDAALQDEGGGVVRLELTLPAGSYATVVLRELLKHGDAVADDTRG